MKQWSHVLPGSLKVNDQFWNRYTRLVPEVVLPYQWEILNDRIPEATKSYCIQNLEIAASLRAGARGGTVFQDSDVAKWLEAVAYSLASGPDAELEAIADGVIDLLEKAQQPDGYLNTYYTLVEPENRWRNLSEGHELYCAGHLFEAGVAYWHATGKRKLLDLCTRFAGLLCTVFGPAEGQIHGCPGHPEVELAFVKVANATGEKKYSDLALYFIDIRGTQPDYLMEEQARPGFVHLFPEFSEYTAEYAQVHRPLCEQETAEGHAVRALYLYSAMADLASTYNDEALLHQCEILWNNIVDRRMYVTGSVGSSGLLERFTCDWDLPNDTNYSETCASIALAMFGVRMAAATRDAKYMDIVERALYNTVRAGISIEGDRYFYVNPLEVYPPACMESTSRAHVKPVRQKWFDVACCPTNVARTFTNLAQYIYGVDNDALYAGLYIQNTAEVLIGQSAYKVDMQTEYPKNGRVTLSLESRDAQPHKFTLCLRVPGFATGYTLEVNGTPVECRFGKGYLAVEGTWQNDIVTLELEFAPRFLFANPLVRANCGRVSLQRGPEIYCLEGEDNGDSLAGIYVDTEKPVQESWNPVLMGGTMVLTLEGKRQTAKADGSVCGREALTCEDIHLTAVPYGSWGNRQPGEMKVWLNAL